MTTDNSNGEGHLDKKNFKIKFYYNRWQKKNMSDTQRSSVALSTGLKGAFAVAKFKGLLNQQSLASSS